MACRGLDITTTLERKASAKDPAHNANAKLHSSSRKKSHQSLNHLTFGTLDRGALANSGVGLPKWFSPPILVGHILRSLVVVAECAESRRRQRVFETVGIFVRIFKWYGSQSMGAS